MLRVEVFANCTDSSLLQVIPREFAVNQSPVTHINCPTVFYCKISRIRVLHDVCQGSDAQLPLDQPQAVNGHAVVMIHKIDQLGSLESFKELYAALCIAKKGVPASVSRQFEVVIVAEVTSQDQIPKLQGTYEFLRRVQVQTQSSSMSSVSEDLPDILIDPEKLRMRQSELLQQLQSAKQQFREVQSIQFPPTNESMTQVTPDSAPNEDESPPPPKKVSVLQEPLQPAQATKATEKSEPAQEASKSRQPKQDESAERVESRNKQNDNKPETEFQGSGERSSPQKPSLLPQSLIQASCDVISPQTNPMGSQTPEIDMLHSDEMSDAEIDQMLQLNQQMQRELEQKELMPSKKKIQQVQNLRNSQFDEMEGSASNFPQKTTDNVEESSPVQEQQTVQEIQDRQHENAPQIPASVEEVFPPQSERSNQAAPQNEQQVSVQPKSICSSTTTRSPMQQEQKNYEEQQHHVKEEQKRSPESDEQLRASVRLMRKEMDEFNSELTRKLDSSPFEASSTINQLVPVEIATKAVESESVAAESQHITQNQRKSAVDFDFKTKDVNPRYLVYLVEVEELLRRHRILYERPNPDYSVAAVAAATQIECASRVEHLPMVQRLEYRLDSSYKAAYFCNSSLISASALAGGRQQQELSHEEVLGEIGADEIESRFAQPIQGLTAEEQQSVDALNQLGSYLEEKIVEREQNTLSQSALNFESPQKDKEYEGKNVEQEPQRKKSPGKNSQSRTMEDTAVLSDAMNEVGQLRRQIKRIKSDVAEIHEGLLQEARRTSYGPNLVERARDCRRNIWEIRGVM